MYSEKPLLRCFRITHNKQTVKNIRINTKEWYIYGKNRDKR